MNIFRDISAIPPQYRDSVVVLGNFDGFHLGHRSILTDAQKIAAEEKLPLAVMTFEPHPREFFATKKAPNGLRISNLHSKLAQFAAFDVDYVLLARFNQSLADMSAEDFITNILVSKLQARYVITGDNFCFGKGRKGDKHLLASFALKHGFEYIACGHTEDENGVTISSSAVRNLLKDGNIKKVNALLGMPYNINGRVKHGESRGKTLGFPTANIGLNKLFIPRYGVYAVKISIEGEREEFLGIANIGVKPTFGVSEPLLEVNIFELEKNLYGKRICVEFIDFIRDEKKFGSLEELKNQITLDCDMAKKILNV